LRVPTEIPRSGTRRPSEGPESYQYARARLRDFEDACGRFVPKGLLDLIGAANLVDVRLGEPCERQMTILFADIRDFTALSEDLSPRDTFAFINAYLAHMEPVIAAHGGLIDKYIGDGIMALFPGDPDQALDAGVAMLAALDEFNEERAHQSEPPVRIGIGLNTGIVAIGAVGGPGRMENTVLGDAVNLGSRLETLTKIYGTPLIVGERTLYGLQEPSMHGVRMLDRIRVKGKHHPESVYEVFDGDPPALRAGKLTTRRIFEEALAYYHLREVARAEPLFERCVEIVPDDAPARLYLRRCQEVLAGGAHHGTGELDGTLEWRDEFNLGVDVMDFQHRELLLRINNLGEEVKRGDTCGRTEVLRFVGEYAAHHFAAEEELMERFEYPLREEHAHAHLVFGRYFRELQREIDEGTHDPLYLVFRVQVFLVDWFVHHTTRTDRHLARFLRERGASHSLAPV
jgi:hemerythrin